MEDLAPILQVLQDALASSARDETTFTGLVEKYLQSSDPAIRRSVLETLIECVEQGDEERKKFIFDDTALTYIPLILPLLTEYPVQAKQLFSWIAGTSRPREVVLGCEEALQGIGEKIEGYQVSDPEDGFEEEGEELSQEDLVQQTIVIVRCYGEAISRLPNTKSSPTLLTLSEAISSTLPELIQYTDSNSSTSLLLTVSHLIRKAWKWVQSTSDRGGEQRAILSQLLWLAVSLLGPRVEASLVERWFLAEYPKFERVRKVEDSWQAGQEALQLARETATELGLDQVDLLDRLITRPSSVEPPNISPHLLSDSIPVLTAALSSSAVDAALTWLWYLIQSDQVYVTHDQATLLLELLVPLAALPPSPITRLAVIKLIAAMIASVEAPKEQILLFRQLLEPANPFDQVRLQALSMLSESTSSPNSRILTKDLLPLLSPILFSLNPTTSSSSPPLKQPPRDLLSSMYIPWFTSCAHYYWLLVQIDHENETGVRDEDLREKVPSWIEEQRGVIEDVLVWLKKGIEDGADDLGNGTEVRFLVRRWRDGLDRALAAVQGFTESNAGGSNGIAHTAGG